MPVVKEVYRYPFYCGCGYGQKGDDGSGTGPQWDGSTYVEASDPKSVTCPAPDHPKWEEWAKQHGQL